MLLASQAQKYTADWLTKAIKENNDYNKARARAEQQQAQVLWKKYSDPIIIMLETHIVNQSKEGHHNLNLPSDINPNGDIIYWLRKDLWPIKKLLMEYFYKNKFQVEEYSDGGIKITW